MCVEVYVLVLRNVFRVASGLWEVVEIHDVFGHSSIHGSPSRGLVMSPCLQPGKQSICFTVDFERRQKELTAVHGESVWFSL